MATGLLMVTNAMIAATQGDKTMECKICGLPPNEIQEYIDGGKDYKCTPHEYVIQEEGTYNRFTELFYCTECYVRIGMPLGKA